MARICRGVLVLVAASTAVAAPREKSPSSEALAAGDQFARQLGVVVQMVSREYVRPVPTQELYGAAIKALYDEGRRPQPLALLQSLESAKSEAERIELLVLARAKLHGTTCLEAGHDLFVAVQSLTKVLDPYSLLLPSSAINGTETANAYGFEFDGEASLAHVRQRWPRLGGDPSPGASAVTSAPALPFRVIHVKPGSPAQRSGLRPGDLVRSIDGIEISNSTAARAYEALHGAGPDKAEPGTHILRVETTDRAEPVKIKLVRAEFIAESLFGVTRNDDNTWDYWLDRRQRIAYIRLGGIESDSGEKIQDILHDLRDVRGLVFDLRWCPGGYIDAATQIASTFLDAGVIAKMKYRNPERGGDNVIRADAGLVRFKAGDYPLLLLVNGDTIGGGELVAAALRDNERAVVAGTRTFGKASIQWPIATPGLPDYSFKLTGGTYSRPNGKNLQRFADAKPTDDWGLRPDPGYDIPMSADLSRHLKEMHLLYALRPGGSRTALDLDDPAADPQRARALKLLVALVEQRAKKGQ